MDESKVLTFRYESTDFYYTIKNHGNPSKFDEILEKKWKEAEEQGILRYKLKIEKSKILQGSYKFLAQLNLDRATNRRTPENIESMSQPFRHDRFNFTQLPENEILLDIGDGSGNDVIAVNVSPIEYGHCLFLPNRMECLPQKITQYSLLKALNLLLLSNSPYFRIIFNSLCAHASVNHLHWHLYYLKHEMLLETIELQELKVPVFALENYPAKGFCLKLSSFPERDIKNFASWAFFAINYLQESNVAHNVYITRAKTNPQNEHYDDIRIFIWPRKPSHGIKNTRAFVPAVCEFFGHLSIRNEEDFDHLTEEEIAFLLDDVTKDTFNVTKNEIRDKIFNKTLRQPFE